MRKIFGLALIAGLIAVGCAFFNPSSSDVSVAQSESQQIAELHQNDSPSMSAIALEPLSQEVSAEDVTYGTIGDIDLTGYFAQPANATEPLPGLIVIQQWWGLTDDIKAMTRRLAGEGYAALAVDLYDDQVAETPEEARSLVQAALENPERLEQNVVAAYTYLTNERNAPTVGSIGWCLGGTWSLNTALALPTELDAAVIYYGGQITTEGDRLATLQMPIQGHFGALDSRPSPETVREFESVLTDLGKDAEIYLYEGADHAFANPGERYNPEAAELAWERTLEFLNQNLKR
ncbi:MAG: dienelactone hydrolase family protein [Leptolyngbyaceae bacterium]|nr:dienelactone hydrolase family protein [Leptolyngbyaceae bacterium]